MIKFLVIIVIFFTTNTSFANEYCSTASNGCSIEHLRTIEETKIFKEAINNYFKLKVNIYSFNKKYTNKINYNDLFTYNIIV